MARISMRNVQKSSVSEYFDLYLSSAAARGVKDKTLQTYKNHFRSTVSTIKKLCDGLGITIDEFFHSDLFSGLEQEIK